jgi:hypothetical protein
VPVAAEASDLHGAGHVVDRLEDAHEVVALVSGRLGSVARVEPDAILDPAAGEVLLGQLDRGRVEVESVDGHLRVRPCDLDRRPARPARHVGHAAATRGERPVDLGKRLDPGADLMGEHRAVDLRLSEPRLGVGVPRDALARSEGVDHAIDHHQLPRRVLGEGARRSGLAH